MAETTAGVISGIGFDETASPNITLRDKIIVALVAALKAYTGYTAIVSPDVFRGVQLFDPDVDPMPVIAVMPGVETVERTQYGSSRCSMPVDISCLVAIGDANPSKLGEAVLGELIKAAFSATLTHAEDIIYTSGGIADYPDELGQAVLSVGITVNIVYQTDLGDPYQLTT